MEILYTQFHLHLTSNGISISDSEKMGTDEFELFVHMFNERQREIEKNSRSGM
jgi:hypothetical protein